METFPVILVEIISIEDHRSPVSQVSGLVKRMSDRKCLGWFTKRGLFCHLSLQQTSKGGFVLIFCSS